MDEPVDESVVVAVVAEELDAVVLAADVADAEPSHRAAVPGLEHLPD